LSKQCAAVDLEKAFNSTQREQIIRLLNGTNEKLIKDIANIYMEDFRHIQLEKSKIEKNTCSGIKQGCNIISLPLYSFNIIINENTRKLNRNFKSSHDPNALFFADESLLLADNEQELKAKIMFI